MKLCKSTSQDRDEAKSKPGQAVALAAGISHFSPQAPHPAAVEELVTSWVLRMSSSDSTVVRRQRNRQGNSRKQKMQSKKR